jgi:hypothetical protein
MTLKRSIKVVLWPLVFIIGLPALDIFLLVVAWSTNYWWDRDQWNQERIAQAYIHFYTDRTNFPTSLADLVRAGYLPERAEWYKEPPGIFNQPVHFKESSYIVQAPASGDVQSCDMIGRRMQLDGKEQIDFTSSQNDIVREEILRLQQKPEFRVFSSPPHAGDK